MLMACINMKYCREKCTIYKHEKIKFSVNNDTASAQKNFSQKRKIKVC